MSIEVTYMEQIAKNNNGVKLFLAALDVLFKDKGAEFEREVKHFLRLRKCRTLQSTQRKKV